MTPRRLLVTLPSVLLCLCGCLFAQEPDYPTPAFWYLAEEFHAVSMELVDISQSFPENSVYRPRFLGHKLDTSLSYAAWRRSCSSRASIGV
jgi:hypothetical protein